MPLSKIQFEFSVTNRLVPGDRINAGIRPYQATGPKAKKPDAIVEIPASTWN
jgi:hypothetical protein